jgi:hypothetical protein
VGQACVYMCMYMYVYVCVCMITNKKHKKPETGLEQ